MAAAAARRRGMEDASAPPDAGLLFAEWLLTQQLVALLSEGLPESRAAEAVKALERFLCVLANDRQEAASAARIYWRRVEASEAAAVKLAGELAGSAGLARALRVVDRVNAFVAAVQSVAAVPAPLHPFTKEEGPAGRLVGYSLGPFRTRSRYPLSALYYAALSPGGHQQWSIPHALYSWLRAAGYGIEAFASPLNSGLAAFQDAIVCSVAPEVDSLAAESPRHDHFRRSFFALPPETPGNIVANPPFIETLMARCLDKCETLLAARPRCVALVLPRWEDSPPVVRALGSRLQKGALLLRGGRHYYERWTDEQTVARVDTRAATLVVHLCTLGYNHSWEHPWRLVYRTEEYRR